jgi:hypothetical protein
MAKPLYKLTQAHYLSGGIYADAGSTVGDVAEGADYPWDPEVQGPPTMAMEPLNQEARDAIVKTQRLFNPLEELPLTVGGDFNAGGDDATVANLKDSENRVTDGNAQIEKKLQEKRAEGIAKDLAAKAPSVADAGSGKPAGVGKSPVGTEPNKDLPPKG